MKKLFFLFVLFSSCTNASYKQFTSLGSAANVKCYSGGVLILDTKSTGKVLTEKQSSKENVIAQLFGETIHGQ